MALVVSIVNPWLLIPSFIMALIMFGLRVIYIRTTRCLNRIESTSRSPVFTHINATIQGLSTVRAFKAQKVLHTEYNNYQDRNTGALHLFYAATRSFALWLDLACVSYIAIVTYSFLFIETGKLIHTIIS